MSCFTFYVHDQVVIERHFTCTVFFNFSNFRAFELEYRQLVTLGDVGLTGQSTVLIVKTLER